MLQYRNNIPYEPYSQRLQRYDMMQLKTRRTMINELTLYKILHSKIKTGTRNEINFSTTNRTKRQNFTFTPNVVNNNVQFFSPMRRFQMDHDRLFINIDITNDNYMNFKRQIRNNIENMTDE